MDVDVMFAKEGYTKSYADYICNIKQTSDYLVIVIIYVDDLIIIANIMKKMKEMNVMLKNMITMILTYYTIVLG